MRNILVLGLVGTLGVSGLTSCHLKYGPDIPAGPTLYVSISSAVGERCGKVRWTDTTWNWESDTKLSGYRLWQRAYETSGEVTDFSQKSISLDSVTPYSLVNIATPQSVIDSTFTCTKTGEFLKASYTFPTTGSSASIVLDVQNGQLVGEWKQYNPPA